MTVREEEEEEENRERERKKRTLYAPSLSSIFAFSSLLHCFASSSSSSYSNFAASLTRGASKKRGNDVAARKRERNVCARMCVYTRSRHQHTRTKFNLHKTRLHTRLFLRRKKRYFLQTNLILRFVYFFTNSCCVFYSTIT